MAKLVVISYAAQKTRTEGYQGVWYSISCIFGYLKYFIIEIKSLKKIPVAEERGCRAPAGG